MVKYSMKNISFVEINNNILFHLIIQLCLALRDPMDCSPPGSSVHDNSPGKNTGVGCRALLQRIFPTKRSNLGLLHCRWILYHLSYHGSPSILEWVACPFSRVTSQPRNETRVSCITGRFFTSWATQEAFHIHTYLFKKTMNNGNY